MNQMRLTKLAIACSTVACATMLSFGWSEQRGVSLSIESAQARVGRPLTPMSVAGVARRQNRRAAYGYGYYGDPNNSGGLVGGDDPGVGGGFGRVSYGPTGAWGTGWGGWGTQASYAGPAYAGPAYAGASGWYLKGGVMACTSGMWVTGGNGLPFRCP